MSISEKLAAALALSTPDSRRVPSATLLSGVLGADIAPGSRTAASSVHAVVQLNPLPTSLDPGRYADPLSNTNPSGDIRSSYAFRALVDPLPLAGRTYRLSGRSTEEVYESIVTSANTDDDAVASVLATTRKRLDAAKMANLDGTAGTWRPVHAVPDDWWAAHADRFTPLSLDLGAEPVTTLLEPELALLRVGGDGAARTLDPSTRLKGLDLEYLHVRFERSWLDLTLFSLDRWWFGQEAAGWVSSGDADDNDGIFAYLPTGLLLGRQVSLDVDWGPAEQALVDTGVASGRSVHLGPFPVAGGGADGGSPLYVVGWTCAVLPRSPRVGSHPAGEVVVSNSGAFVARFAVEWTERGRPVRRTSGHFPIGVTRRLEVPKLAADVRSTVEVMTFPGVWSTVLSKSAAVPPRWAFRLSGTTLDVDVDPLR